MESRDELVGSVTETAKLFGLVIDESQSLALAQRLRSLMDDLEALWEYDLQGANNPLYPNLRERGD